jgi:hypothetical protein
MTVEETVWVVVGFVDTAYEVVVTSMLPHCVLQASLPLPPGMGGKVSLRSGPTLFCEAGS